MDWKARLTQARERKGLKKSAFAKAVDVSPATVTDWEKAVTDGGIIEIAGENLTRICNVLGITAGWLYTGRDDSSNDLGPAVELLNLYASLTSESRLRILSVARHEAKVAGKLTSANDETELGAH